MSSTPLRRGLEAPRTNPDMPYVESSSRSKIKTVQSECHEVDLGIRELLSFGASHDGKASH